MKLLATLLTVLLVACSGRHGAAGAEGGAADSGAADGGAAVEPGAPDSGSARSKEAGARALDGGAPERSATADGRAPAVLVPTTKAEDAGHETDVQIVTDSGVKETTPQDASTSDASDGHMADAQIVTDPIPAELPAYIESLEERGFAAAGCSALVSSVEHCCLTVGGSAFTCDRERCSCTGTAFEYSGADALCIIAPAVPLSWECGP